MIKTIRNNAIGLGIFAAFTAGIIAVTQFLTKDTIADEQQKFAVRTLYELLPNELQNESLLEQTILLAPSTPWQNLDALALRESKNGWFALNDGKVAAVVLPATTRQGYSGDIDILVGIDANGTLLGVRVVNHKETPGLGDKVELKKSDWVLQFEGMSLTLPAPEKWLVNKDGGDINHDVMTGATITPRAITAAIKASLEFFAANKQQLLNQAEVNNGN